MSNLELAQEVRRLLVQTRITDKHVVLALATCTEELYRAGVMSLGDTGRRVWVFGEGEGVIIHEYFGAEPTTYTIFLLNPEKVIMPVKWEEFRYVYS